MMASYELEAKLGDYWRAATIRREALEWTTGSSLKGLPLDGLDYESILGQYCENPMGVICTCQGRQYIANKSKLKGDRPIPRVEHAAFKTSKLGKLGERVHQSNSGLQKGKQKSLSFKIYNEAQTDCYVSDNEKIEQGKLVKKTLWNASSTADRKREENHSV